MSIRKGAAPLVIGAIAWLSAFGASSDSAGAAFCETGIVHNYKQPLEQLPHIREAPLREHLSFGPARIFMGQIGSGPLVVGSDAVGFGLSYSPFYPGHHLSPPLNWLVEAQLARVDRHGRTTQTLEKISKRVGRLRSTDDQPSGDLDLSFPVSKPALYRVEITFTDRTGKRLGRYGKYFRVLRPSQDARLTLNGTEFHPGETVTARLENHGTDSLSYGLGRTIERYDGSTWTVAPESSQGAVPAIGLSSGPGESASCWSFTIPPSEPPGRYRFVWSGDAFNGSSVALHTTHLRLEPEFQILPS
jgi:hypothetical protein